MRKDIPDRQKPLKALLPQVESLENGISDLSRWIDEGEKLLATHKVDGDINILEDRLDKHKVFCALMKLVIKYEKKHVSKEIQNKAN